MDRIKLPDRLDPESRQLQLRPPGSRLKSPISTLWSLPVVRLHAVLEAQAPLMTHAYNGPMIRGCFGTALRHIYGLNEWYQEFFEPCGALENRPFRLWDAAGTHHLGPKGSLVSFRLDLYGAAASQAQRVLPALIVMGHIGLGERRVRAKLVHLSQLTPQGSELLLARRLDEAPRPQVHALSGWLPAEPPIGLEMAAPFVPSRGREACLPEMARAGWQRLRALNGLRPEIDPIPAGREEGTWRLVSEARRSRREGVQPLSGVVGRAIWRGEFSSWLSAGLCAASLVGTGRHTSMGMGDARLIFER